MNVLTSLIICFSMYSIIPMPRMDWTEERMKYCFCFFPAVGAAAGGLWILLYNFLSANDFSHIFTAILLMLISVILSGGIHMDGFIDTCDAIFSYGDKEKKLEILKDPRTGAFGVMGCGIYFLGLFGLYMQIMENAGKWVYSIPMIFVISRVMGAGALILVKKAKPNGLGSGFAGAASRKINLLVLGVWVLIALLLLFDISIYLAVAAILLLAVLLLIYVPFIKRQFGGISGDLTGFLIMAVEWILTASVAICGKILL